LSASPAPPDNGTPVGHGKFPPGVYAGSSFSFDTDFNFTTESRSLDLEPDDDHTADFGAPTLSQVRPIPRGAAGGPATVTGIVASSDATAHLHVTVNNVVASVGAGGAFSASTVIGTGPLTVLAFDDQGRTTTLKRYFTTMSGLFAPVAGADLVSQGQDLNSIETTFFAPPLAKMALNPGRTVPLKLTGALGTAAVTNANASAPRVFALFSVAPFMSATPIALTGDPTFRYDTSGKQWINNLSTVGLQAGTYVVQIQFWDGRILEAALVLF
jgi:hypothetical protein